LPECLGISAIWYYWRAPTATGRKPSHGGGRWFESSSAHQPFLHKRPEVAKTSQPKASRSQNDFRGWGIRRLKATQRYRSCPRRRSSRRGPSRRRISRTALNTITPTNTPPATPTDHAVTSPLRCRSSATQSAPTAQTKATTTTLLAAHAKAPPSLLHLVMEPRVYAMKPPICFSEGPRGRSVADSSARPKA
jgi:hypothetical protein